jgi:chromosome segregation ATPase
LRSRKAAVTTNVVKEYKEMITNTTSDLEDHLQEIDKRLQTLYLQGARVSDEDAAEREQILEERDSTKQCLTICAQVSEHLDRVRPTVFEDISAAPDSHQKIVTPLRGLIPSKQVTTKVLRECKEKLIDTAFKLEEHLHKIDNRLANHSSREGRISDEVEAERERVQQERDSVTQCLSICAKASEQVDKVQTNVFEDVSAAEEAHQVIVATLGDLISATRVNAGARADQWLGQMSDDTVLQLSRDRGMANRASRERALEQESGMLAKFEDLYGAGYRLQWGAVVPTPSV